MTETAATPSPKKNQRGATVIIFTMMCSLLLIPIAGLAIDGAVIYLMKAKLSAAVDAAALATARGLSVGTSLAAQTSAAIATGQSYFAANLPAGTMGATMGTPVITVTSTSDNTLQASVTGTVTVPLFLLRILGIRPTTLVATGQASRRVSNIIFVLDRSYSMVQSNSCSAVVGGAKSFVNLFVDGRDTLGLVTFQSTANLDYTPTTTFKSGSSKLTDKIDQLQCTGYTNTPDALALAYAQIKAINQPLANNVIVLFTDGKPDSFTAKFTVAKTSADTRYDWWSTGSQVPVAATSSTCSSSIQNKTSKGVVQGVTGVIIDILGTTDATGYTGGIYANTSEPINWTSPYQGSGIPFPASVISASGCNFTSSLPYGQPYDSMALRADIPYLPTTDINGNSTTGTHWAVAQYTSGAYKNNYRIDTPAAIMYGAMNATDNMADSIRSDTTYKPTIYAVGLGDINTDLMERIANDPRSSSYDSTQATGVYILCTPATIAAAFQQIASQILRLSR